jgi:hypothetical protein
MWLQHVCFRGNIADRGEGSSGYRVTRITAPSAEKVTRCSAGCGVWRMLRGTKPGDVHITLEG